MTTDHSDKISELSPEDRYKYFINRIAVNQELWTVIDTDGNFALFEVNNTTVFSLWPDEASIESNLTPDWIEYIPFKLDYAALEETVIPIIRQNNYLINVFPVDSRTGHLVSLIDFVNDFNRELLKN